MAEQLEIVIGANVDDAKAGINSLGQTLDQFAKQGKLSIGVLEQTLVNLRATIKTTTDPLDLQKLNAAFKETNDRLVALRNEAGLQQNLGGISRAARTAHSDIDQLSRDLTLFASGNERAGDALSNLVFTFERLQGQTGGLRGAFAALGEAFTSPAGIILGIAAAINLLGPFISKLFEASDAEKKAAEQTKELKKQLDELKSVSEIKIQAQASVTGEIEKVNALAKAIEDTNLSYAERQHAVEQLQQVNKNFFGDIKLETDGFDTLTTAVNEYTQAIIAAAVVSGFTDQIKKLSPELQNANKSLNDNVEAVKKWQDQLAAFKQTPDFLNLKTTAQQIEAVGSFASKNIDTFTAYQKAQKAIIDQAPDLQKLRSAYADIEDQIGLAVDETLKFKSLTSQASAVDTKGITEAQRKIIELAKLASTIFDVPIPLRFEITDDSKAEFKKAQDIIKGIEEHTIRLKFISLTETKGIEAELKDIEVPQLKLKIDDKDLKQQILDTAKGAIIPLTVALDKPSLLETEDQIKQIFSKFSDTNIFSEAGRNAGEKFRKALIDVIDTVNKDFLINPKLDITDLISSLNTSLAGIKNIEFKVIKTETFENALRTLRDLHDAGVEAGNAVEKAFVKAGFSAEDAAKAGKAFAAGFGGITKEAETAAKAISEGLTSAITGVIDAFASGQNPAKAFFDAIINSLEQVIAKIIQAQIEQLILNTLFKAASAAFNPLSLLGLVGLGFAEGGEPPVNQPFIVGEKGPELMITKTQMHVFSNQQTRSILSESVKEHESIKEYLIAEKVSQQIKEHFTAAFKSVESSIKVLVTNNERLAAYSYHLHDNIQSLVTNNIQRSHESIKTDIERLKESFVSTSDKNTFSKLNEVITGLKESFSSVDKESLSKELVVNNTDSKSFDKINSSIKEAINVINNATIVNNSASYENLIERFKTSMSNDKSIISNSDTKQFASTIDKLYERVSLSNSQINSLIERSGTIDKSVTIERIINNNFYTSKTTDSLKQMSLHDLQHTFHIPAFAGGGAVFGPTLAILGEGFGISRSNPEFVGTANQLRGIQGGAFDVNVNVGGELSFSMGKLAIALNREVRSQLRTSGKHPF